jgi:hypothetical protein
MGAMWNAIIICGENALAYQTAVIRVGDSFLFSIIPRILTL